ncbi:MAG: PHB depolymerase family esterase [Rhizobacter sp.]|nr:PHB depolymerase family esterase [Rhizobacter sp.]
MARRIRKSPWAGALSRTFNAMTRATLRASTRAVVKAAKKVARQAVAKAARKTTPRKPPRVRAARTASAGAAAGAPSNTPAKAAGAGAACSAMAIGASGARRYQLFKPPGARKSTPLPLLVMLHGCAQDAQAFARSTRMNRLAAREGFIVLWPEQDRLANSQGCWNWFDTRAGRAYKEAASIVSAIDDVCARHGADPARVAVAGLSAGASLAALLATRYPERFKAVAMHSGIAPGAANSTATALAAMQGRRKPAALAMASAGAAALPPLLVIHGTADTLVRPGNGRAAAQAWADAAGAQATAPRTVQRGKRYPVTVTDFKLKARVVASLCEIAGLGHAWSGGAASQAFSDPKGPNASRMIWAFAARQFR